MPFSAKPEKYNSNIVSVKIGTGEKQIQIGGESVLPFCTFDNGISQRPEVGIEITDDGLENEPSCIKKIYDGCNDVVQMAERAASFEGVDFLSVRLRGADPSGEKKTAVELIPTVKGIADAVDLPLVICGCGNPKADAELLPKVAEVLNGKNALILSAQEENYAEIGGVTSFGQVVGAESAVDINLAKQLNVLLLQLGINQNALAMVPGSAAVGYGFDYLISTLDRIKLAGLSMGDSTLQMPIVISVASEAWSVKESTATEEEMPEWGDMESRGIDMEVVSAAAALACGADAVILKHPESVRTITAMIDSLN